MRRKGLCPRAAPGRGPHHLGKTGTLSPPPPTAPIRHSRELTSCVWQTPRPANRRHSARHRYRILDMAFVVIGCPPYCKILKYFGN